MMDTAYTHTRACKAMISFGSRVESGRFSARNPYNDTDTALAECVDGNPYSKAALFDIDMRCKGGDKGRGRQRRSFSTPVKKTPAAKVCIKALARRVFPHQNSIGRHIM